jgi:hypothetical protein
VPLGSHPHFPVLLGLFLVFLDVVIGPRELRGHLVERRVHLGCAFGLYLSRDLLKVLRRESRQVLTALGEPTSLGDLIKQKVAAARPEAATTGFSDGKEHMAQTCGVSLCESLHFGLKLLVDVLVHDRIEGQR